MERRPREEKRAGIVLHARTVIMQKQREANEDGMQQHDSGREGRGGGEGEG